MFSAGWEGDTFGLNPRINSNTIGGIRPESVAFPSRRDEQFLSFWGIPERTGTQ